MIHVLLTKKGLVILQITKGSIPETNYLNIVLPLEHFREHSDWASSSGYSDEVCILYKKKIKLYTVIKHHPYFELQ